jgi:hypothetical protein
MIWLLSITGIILMLFCTLLFIPFYLEMDSRIGLCRFRFLRLASATFYLDDDSIFLNMKIAWWYKKFDLLQPGRRRKNISEKSKKESGRKRIPLKKMTAIFRSFKVNKFQLTIDTGSMQLNGILYPLFSCISTNKPVTINFNNENSFVFEIENNIARMVWAFIKS